MEHHQGEGGRGREALSPPNPPIINAPPVVIHLALAIIAAHVVFLVAPDSVQSFFVWIGAVSPFRVTHLRGGLIASALPLVGHIFLHAGWMHLLLNCVWLVAFGAPVARMMGAEQGAGQRRAALYFLLFFMASGVAGAFAYIAAHPNDATMLIGASGAVSGLLGGLVRFAFRPPPEVIRALVERGSDGRNHPGSAIWAGLFDRTVLIWSAAIVILNLIVGVFAPGIANAGAGIAWESHIGGYFFGLVAFPYFARLARGA